MTRPRGPNLINFEETDPILDFGQLSNQTTSRQTQNNRIATKFVYDVATADNGIVFTYHLWRWYW